jgi:hypothetical protein
MAEVIKSSVRRSGQPRGDRNRKTPTTIKSKLDKKSSTFANPAGSQAKKDVQTGWPYKEDKSFPGQPAAKVGKSKPKTIDQPIYKRDVKGPKDISKDQKLSTSGRKTPSPDWGGAFSKWVGDIGDDIGEYASDVASGASIVGKKVGDWSGGLSSSFSANELWDKFAKQFDGEVPKKPPASAKKKLNKFVKMEAPGKPMPPASAKSPPPVAAPKKLAKETTKKKDISKAEAERRIAAREAQIKRERAAEASKKKKAAPSVDGRTKAVQDKEESMAGFAGDKPKEETADFKDFLSKHGGVKGFQFNLVGKNKTKEAGMKLARERYKAEQDDRYHDKEKLNEKDEYKYGSKRRLVKKKNAGPIRSIGEQMKSIPGQIKATRKIKKANKKGQGGTIRLKTGGAVIDTYDYS